MKPTDHTERNASPTVQSSARGGTAAGGSGTTSRQRGPNNDPAMRDGNSGHGNSDYEPDALSTDADVGDMTDVLDDEAPEDDEPDEMEVVQDDEPDPADVVAAADEQDLSAEEMIAADEGDMHDLERAGPSPAERAAHDRTDASAERVMNGGRARTAPSAARRTGPPDAPAGASPKRQREFGEMVEGFRAEGRYPGREEEVAARIVNQQRAEFGETAEAKADERHGDNPDRGLPISGYQHLTVPQVLDKLADLSDDEVAAVREFERTHRNRKTLMERLDRHLSGGRRQSVGSQ